MLFLFQNLFVHYTTMVVPKLDWSFQYLQFKSIDTPDSAVDTFSNPEVLSVIGKLR